MFGPARAQDKPAREERPAGNEKPLFDKKYKLTAPDGEQDLGTYELKTVARPSDKRIDITESASIHVRGSRLEFQSVVTYGTAGSPVPEKGTTETKIDGKICMQGTVAFTEKTFHLECIGLMEKRTLEAIDPPRKFEKQDLPKPPGVLLFLSALAVIGPRLLAKEGTLENVHLVEFPDDIGAPELINLEEGHRIVRGKPDAQGAYDMELFSPYAEDSILKVRFDAKDRVVQIPTFANKWKLVEIKAEQQNPADSGHGRFRDLVNSGTGIIFRRVEATRRPLRSVVGPQEKCSSTPWSRSTAPRRRERA